MPRSSKQGNDIAVQGTNDSSIVSKCSMASQGYFIDEYLKMFVSKTSRRAPLINRGYYIRARAIDDILKEFLSCFQDEKKQIISLGAGFDSAFFRLKASGHLNQTTFFEVDFVDVVQRKAAIITSKPSLKQVVGKMCDVPSIEKGIYLTSSQYYLLGVDLTNLPFLEQCLEETGIDYLIPTLILSECVLTYMEVRSSNAVIQWAATSFSSGVFITYEQICPDDAFGMVMQKHFEKLNSPLKAIQTYATEKQQQQRFQSLGWQGTSAIDMNSYYYYRVPMNERQRLESLEPFDEFEEWHLKCSHYAVIAGYNGSCQRMKKCFIKDETKSSSPEASLRSFDQFSLSPLQTRPLLPSTCHHPAKRFGHASALMSPDNVIIIGGFGEAGSRHARLGDVVIMDFEAQKWTTVEAGVGVQELAPRMFPTLTSISGSNRWFLFGGRSSPTKPVNDSFVLSLHKGSQARQPSSDQSIVRQIPSNCIQNSSTEASNCSVKSVEDIESGRKTTVCDVEINGAAKNGLVEENKRCVEIAEHLNDLETCLTVSLDCESKDCKTLDCFDSPLVCEEAYAAELDEATTKSVRNVQNNFSSGKPDEPLLYSGSRMNYKTLASKSGAVVSCSGQDLRNKTRSVDTDNRDLKEHEKMHEASSQLKNLKNTKVSSNQESNEACFMDSFQPHTTQSETLCYSYTEVHSSNTPEPRWRHTAVQSVLNGEECVVIYGGRGVDNTVFGDCWLCDVTKLEWKQLILAGNRPPPSHSHSACVWQDTRMIIAGGLGPDLQPISSVYVVELETLRCHEMDLRPTLQPRYSHTAHVIDDNLLLVGGVNPHGASSYTVAIIDLKLTTWCMYSLQACDIEHPLMVHSHSSKLLSRKRLVVIGGGGNCFSFGTHLNHSPVEIRLPLKDKRLRDTAH